MGLGIEPGMYHLDKIVNHGQPLERQHLSDQRNKNISGCGKGIECHQSQRGWTVKKDKVIGFYGFTLNEKI